MNKQYPKSYRVVGDDGDGIPFWKVVEVIGGIELFIKGVSRDRTEMQALAQRLNQEANK